MNKKIIELEKIINNAIAEIKEAFDEVKSEVVEVDKPEFETVRRAAGIGEQILITSPEEDSAGEKGEIFTVVGVDPAYGHVDVDEIRRSDEWAFMLHEYEVIIEPEQLPFVKELTPNEQRAELIRKAKELNAPYEDNFRFEVDEEKRTVFAYSVFQEEGRYNAVSGLSVCDSDEVFNEYIEKSIAILKALEIDVPDELLNAVQPEELEVGHVIRRFGVLGEPYEAEIASISAKETYYTDGGMDWTVPNLEGIRIINDTNAIYSESDK